ncbi:MAG: hypothetical protein GY723_05755 [bacterium]|nr:hypothetical protein [bacterium]MCP5069928.1 hypothetical protein [bacterium]
MARGTEARSKARTRTETEPEVPGEAASEFAKFERLDGLVRTLVERFQALHSEHIETLAQLAKRDEQIRDLNQRRQDAGKRLDDVLARLDQLDVQLERRQALPSDDGS